MTLTADRIDRRPATFVNVTSGVRNSRIYPELNKYGYNNWFRTEGPAGVLARFDQALAAGLPARFIIGKPIGTQAGSDVTGNTAAMPEPLAREWALYLPPWIQRTSHEHPDLSIGVYTGSGTNWPGQDALYCDPDNPCPAYDTDDQEAQARFNAAHGFWLGLGCNALYLDKASVPTDSPGRPARIHKTIRTAERAAAADAFTGREVRITSEAIRAEYADRLAMMARTEFWVEQGMKDARFDPETTEIHWLLQNDGPVPDYGAPLAAFVQRIADQGVIPMCFWPFAADAIAAVYQAHPFLRNNQTGGVIGGTADLGPVIGAAPALDPAADPGPDTF